MLIEAVVFLVLIMFNLSVVNGKVVGFDGKGKVYIGRGSYGKKGSVLGNKFVVGKDGNRNEVVEKYRKWLWVEFKKKSKVYEELVRIGRKVKNGEKVDLVCWCAPKRCHGDVVRNCIKWMIKDGLV